MDLIIGLPEENIKDVEYSINEALNYILRRWYDKDKRIQEAFEYFRIAPLDVQKTIAKELLKVLQIA